MFAENKMRVVHTEQARQKVMPAFDEYYWLAETTKTEYQVGKP